MNKEDKKGWNSRPDLDNLLEGFQIIGFDWKYLYLNKTAQIQSKLKKRELVGKRFDEVWQGVEETELYRLIKNCLENKTAHHLENEFIYPDQTLGWFDLSIQPVPEGALILSVDITGRKQVESELRESENKFRNLVWDMHVGVTVQGPGTEILMCNPAALELLGLTENQLLGKTSFDPDWNVIHEDGSPFPVQARPPSLAIEYREPVRDIVMGIYRPSHRDRVWLLVDAVPQLNDDGSVNRVTSSFINISERKIAEKALVESESKFRKIYEEGPFGMALVNKEFRFLAANNTFSQIMGYTEEELQELTFKDITITEEVENNVKFVTKLIKGEIPVYKTEKHYIRKDGVFIWGSLTVTSNYNQDGQFLYNLAILEDITDRKQAENALRESEEKFRLLIENIPLPVISSDKDGKVIFRNNQFLNTFGYSETDIPTIKEWWEKAYPDPAYRKSVIETREAAVSGPESVYSDSKGDEYRITCKDGSERVVIISGIKIGDKLLATFFDITDRKLIEEEILKLNTDLESRVSLRTSQLVSVNNELEAFSYSVSHDLRAPVRSISGFTQILFEEYGSKLDDEGKRICSVIQENSLRMGTLIDDLLAFSRLNRTELNKSVVNMKDLVSSAYNELTDEVSVKRIEFNLGNICNSAGDSKMLKQVWINLISNAIKYSSKKEKSIITIGCKKEEGFCVYHIKDNGVGFDMAYMDKLFGVFQRLHGQREFDGTGVGLAIVQRIIQRHGGSTWAKGEVDKGAEFYFSIPIVTEI